MTERNGNGSDILSNAEYEHKLGQSTIKAVDVLCNKTAEEIEASAAALMVAAEEVCQMLKNVAADMRKRGERANAYISGYVNMSASVVETARGLKASIEALDVETQR